MDIFPSLLMKLSAVSLIFCGGQNKVGYDTYMLLSHFKYSLRKSSKNSCESHLVFVCLLYRKSHFPKLGCIHSWYWIFCYHLWSWLAEMKIFSGLKPSFSKKLYIYLNGTLFSFFSSTRKFALKLNFTSLSDFCFLLKVFN